ncbi:MAG: alpha/beta hydrolase family protein [Terrimicrobiaceae bacterium]
MSTPKAPFRSLLFHCLAGVFLACLWTSPVFGQTWTGSANGEWTNSANWNPASVPGKVAALYVDAPVCDFKSWPGGKGKGKGGAPSEWPGCLKAYGFTEEQALAYKFNPVDNLAPLAAAKIPIIAVAGDADDVVPLPENIGIVEIRYRELGGEIQLIVKPGVGHHPHSLTDPTPVVDFLIRHVTPAH